MRRVCVEGVCGGLVRGVRAEGRGGRINRDGFARRSVGWDGWMGWVDGRWMVDGMVDGMGWSIDGLDGRGWMMDACVGELKGYNCQIRK